MLAEKEKLAMLYCTACGYCMPCPHGVDIPRNFFLMNMYRLYGLEDWARREYRLQLKPKREKETDLLQAAACTQCGECETKCPYDLPIRKMMVEQIALFRELEVAAAQEI